MLVNWNSDIVRNILQAHKSILLHKQRQLAWLRDILSFADDEDVDNDNQKDPEKRMVPGAYKGRKTEFHFRWKNPTYNLFHFKWEVKV